MSLNCVPLVRLSNITVVAAHGPIVQTNTINENTDLRADECLIAKSRVISTPFSV